MNINLAGKRALVTGANSGIGAAIALSLADAGAKVAINYLTHPEAADEIVQTIQKKQGEAISIQADVSDPVAVEGMFRQIDGVWQGIDILVNNAGIDGAVGSGLGVGYCGVAPGDRSEFVWSLLLRVRGLETHGATEKRCRPHHQFGA